MGLAIAGAKYRWPGGKIPYEVAPDLGCKAAVDAAIAHWHARTKIRFTPHAGEPDYVLIYRLPGYAISDVGCRTGQQKVGLGDSSTTGTVIHELAHAVGLWHEHCRSDRDGWVTVDLSNIPAAKRGNFAINNIAGVDVPTEDIGAYDYGSIMHYGDRDFAKVVEDPVLTLLHCPAGVEVGQRKALSAGDIATVAAMYP